MYILLEYRYLECQLINELGQERIETTTNARIDL